MIRENILKSLEELWDECQSRNAGSNEAELDYREHIADIFEGMHNLIQTKVIAEVVEERGKQDAKWGAQNHSPAEWCLILGEEVGEVNRAALENHFKYDGANYANYREELIQVAAVAVAMVECIDRNDI